MDARARDSRQAKRRQQILSATLRLLRRHGAGISTAQIAAEAHCSKETLYNWFEDRDGIFRALIEAQAEAMGNALERALSDVSATDFREKLTVYCAILLDIMTGEAVVAVNRVAMAEACQEKSELGEAVLKDWNKRVADAFIRLFKEREMKLDNAEEAFDVLTGLLVGDRQRRLLLGQGARPDGSAMQTVAANAVDQWMRLYD